MILNSFNVILLINSLVIVILILNQNESAKETSGNANNTEIIINTYINQF